ncbi:EI24 domain-containing protein [Nitrosophilus labii]|uniref:EI24 domain-containing protein n=1 Tax=Nitrosophilus labii TaxID=2706014 RepID=UPI001656D3B2|nr:EI24 domain-containing protein [Nitrosophilus labii]
MQKNIFVAAFEDFMTTKFLTLTLAPFFITLLIFSGLIFGAGSEFFDILNQLSQNPDAINDPQIKEFVQEYPIISTIAGSFIFHAITGVIFGILGTGLAILASTAVALIIVGFFTPIIVKEIHKRHYSYIPKEGGVDFISYIVLSVKSILKFIAVFFISIFLYFIPLLNLIALNIPFYYLFSSLLTLDVGGEILTKEELQRVLNERKKEILGSTFILYLISLIPFAGMLLQVYFVSVLAHQFFRIKADFLDKKPKETIEAEIVE